MADPSPSAYLAVSISATLRVGSLATNQRPQPTRAVLSMTARTCNSLPEYHQALARSTHDFTSRRNEKNPEMVWGQCGMMTYKRRSAEIYNGTWRR
ncbi:hypothetical protein IG631_04402 [Alternaria alternata]|nr:hypothetical protein IG631_04402 [Alternaria alternata]